MRQAVAFLVRNWPLKLAAVVLATFLYAGLVVSQNAQVWPGSIPIVPQKLPTNAVLLTNLPVVTSIRYFAPQEIADKLTSSSFSASVDLSKAVATPGSPFVTVKVDVSAVNGVQIFDYTPLSIRVQLDPLVNKMVPIVVDHGAVPPGLQLHDPVLPVSQAQVAGPDSVVRLVTSVQARVVVQPSGLSVDQVVDLVAVDIRDNVLGPVNINPPSVRVQIAVGSGSQTKTLPVNPVVTGTPAVGFQVDSVTVSPLTVTVEGDANALAQLQKVDTQAVSLSGASKDVTTRVGLILPPNVTSVSGASTKVTVSLSPVAATRSYSAGLVLSGAHTDRTYTLSAGSVLVTLGGTVAALDALDPSTLVGVVDVNSLGSGSTTVTVSVSLPADVKLVAVSPPSVVVTVTVIATPAPTLAPSASP